MLKGFKEFIMRGSLVELGVAFIMAGAFAKVIEAMVTVIMDLIGKVGGSPSFSSYKPQGVHIGALLTVLVSFVILAAVVYFLIVVPYEKLQQRRSRGDESEPVADQVTVLTEIRDLLATRSGGV